MFFIPITFPLKNRDPPPKKNPQKTKKLQCNCSTCLQILKWFAFTHHNQWDHQKTEKRHTAFTIISATHNSGNIFCLIWDQSFLSNRIGHWTVQHYAYIKTICRLTWMIWIWKCFIYFLIYTYRTNLKNIARNVIMFYIYM